MSSKISRPIDRNNQFGREMSPIQKTYVEGMRGTKNQWMPSFSVKLRVAIVRNKFVFIFGKPQVEGDALSW